MWMEVYDFGMIFFIRSLSDVCCGGWVYVCLVKYFVCVIALDFVWIRIFFLRSLVDIVNNVNFCVCMMSGVGIIDFMVMMLIVNIRCVEVV